MRKFYLRSRERMGISPLPEEMAGIAGPDVHDPRDRIKNPEDGSTSVDVNLLSQYPLARRDQGRTNRCGGFAGVSGLSMIMQKLTGSGEMLSANDLYWFARKDENRDSGVFMRDLMAAMTEHGACPAMHWPDEMTPLKRPRGIENPDIDRFRFKIRGYERVQVGQGGAEAMRKVLSVEKLPLFVSVQMFRDVSSNACHSRGLFEMPSNRDTPTGYHAMLVVGHRLMNGRRWFILLNSWGQSVGDYGLFYMPEEYVTEEICADVWTLPATNF